MKIIANFALLSLIAPVSVVADRGAPVPTKPLGRCDFTWDCDEDHQCAKGLICADRHKPQLKAAGFDTRTADCGPGALFPLYEVCFDPKLIYNGGGFGDPHFQTFDGTQYSFHGQCDLVMARSTFFANGTGIEIHARTTMVDNWSLISSTAMRVGDDILEIDNDNTVYLNGVKNVDLPLTLAGEYKVSKTEETFTNSEETVATPEDMVVYTIELEKGEVKVSNYRKMLQVDVNAYLPGTEGMLGLQSAVGMIGRDRKTVLTDANTMGAQWQVRDNEPMLFHDARSPQYPERCMLPSVTQRRLRQSDNELRQAEEACAGVMENRRHFCVEDVLQSRDRSVARAYRTYKSAHAV
jgi:von Willebrand factor type D domain